MKAKPGAHRPQPEFAADDAHLFRREMQDVTPARPHNRADFPRPRPRPIPSQTLRDERQALVDSLSGQQPWLEDLETGEALSFLRPGLAQQVLRKLRRGHWVIQDELDLHGLTTDEARQRVAEFLNRSLRQGLRCVRIIHGKGLGSRNREPVLKNKLRAWLMQRDEVLAFCQARPTDGGSGAAVVLLKSPS